MWEDIFTKDTISLLIEKYIFIETEKKLNEQTGKYETKENLIFPRYHQLESIRQLTADIQEHRTQNNYLIEHSAGSGKTKTIAWLAHQLSSLHDHQDKNIFDSIIIINDRLVVDRQLQNATLALSPQQDFVYVLDKNKSSQDLANAIKGNTKIIVSTIQKFRFILDSAKDIKDKTFAIIIDEAHSSTAGQNISAVNAVLSRDTENTEQTVDAIIKKEVDGYKKQPNISTIAFTATPKATTEESFGTFNTQGKKARFHLYSMKQAIEEGFILDVLQNYVTYKTYYQLNKIIENDPELDSKAAKRKIAKYIELHDTNIQQKIEIIVEHFRENIQHQLDGKAKAMVVTSSRKAAIKYKLEFEKYITEHNYQNIRALVAFSGKEELDGVEYSEPGMNHFSEEELPGKFDTDLYQVLLVADKYQTGFDQKKLCAMYVDKKFSSGIAAVQTLSRLNRIYPPYNKTTFILDFKNKYEEIQKAFAPYYTDTILGETINPKDIEKVEQQLDNYNVLDTDAIEHFNDILYTSVINKKPLTSKEKAKMWSLLDKSLRLINSKTDDEKREIKQAIRKFNRFYCFLIQVTSFNNTRLHKKYNYLTYLIKEIEIKGNGTDFIISDKISATDFKQRKTGEVKKPEHISKPEIFLPKPDGLGISEDQTKRLSEIIEEINQAFNKNFNVALATKATLQIRDLLLNDEKLKQSAKANTKQNFSFTYNDSIQEALVNGYSQNGEFFELLLNNIDLKNKLMDVFLEDIYRKLRDEE